MKCIKLWSDCLMCCMHCLCVLLTLFTLHQTRPCTSICAGLQSNILMCYNSSKAPPFHPPYQQCINGDLTCHHSQLQTAPQLVNISTPLRRSPSSLDRKLLCIVILCHETQEELLCMHLHCAWESHEQAYGIALASQSGAACHTLNRISALKMLPMPATAVWSMRMAPTGFLLICIFCHSSSPSASALRGSGPSLAAFCL